MVHGLGLRVSSKSDFISLQIVPAFAFDSQ